MIVFLGPNKWIVTVVYRGEVYEYGPGPLDENDMPGWIWWWTDSGRSLSQALLERIFDFPKVAGP